MKGPYDFPGDKYPAEDDAIMSDVDMLRELLAPKEKGPGFEIFTWPPKE